MTESGITHLDMGSDLKRTPAVGPPTGPMLDAMLLVVAAPPVDAMDEDRLLPPPSPSRVTSEETKKSHNYTSLKSNSNFEGLLIFVD